MIGLPSTGIEFDRGVEVLQRLLVKLLGLYVASAIYIAFFMIWLGRYSWWKGITVGVVINALLFAMFEVWFKVPLFKGEFDPLGFLGY